MEYKEDKTFAYYFTTVAEQLCEWLEGYKVSVDDEAQT